MQADELIVHEFSGTAGPTVALLGGVHGDEDIGVVALRRLQQELGSASIRGSLLVAAPAHIAAWRSRTRVSPIDGGNLARVFPGEKGGGPTETLASEITDRMIKRCDLLVDVHSAGLHYDMPLMAGFIDTGDAASATSAKLADAFGGPFVWRHSGTGPGRSLAVASDLGIPSLYLESPGGGGIEASHLDAYVNGLLRVLHAFSVLSNSPTLAANQPVTYVSDQDGDVDEGDAVHHDGHFVRHVAVGAAVSEGDLLADLYAEDGKVVERVHAARDGYVMVLRRNSRVAAGEMVSVIADLYSK